jgi:predicted transcriptional regulator
MGRRSLSPQARKWESLAIRVTPEVLQQIETIAQRADRTRSKLLGMVIDDFLKRAAAKGLTTSKSQNNHV